MKWYLGIFIVILIGNIYVASAVDTNTFEEGVSASDPVIFSYNCEQGSMLMGSFEVLSPYNSESVNFWILDTGNYSLWYQQGQYNDDSLLSIFVLYNMSSVKGSISWRFFIFEDGMYYLLFQTDTAVYIKGTTEYRVPDEALAFLKGEITGDIIISFAIALIFGYVIRDYFKLRKQIMSHSN